MQHSPELRLWQVSALKAFRDAGGRGYIEVATGAGKTTFALAAAARIRQTRPCNVLVLVPTTSLLDQWRILLERSFSGDVARDVASNESNHTTYILTYKRAANRIRELQSFFESPCLVICDEVHSLGSPGARNIPINMSLFRLGLSATPERQYEPDFMNFLETTLGPRIFRYSIDDAIKDEVLVDFEAVNIKIPFTETERTRYSALSRKLAAAIADDDIDAIKRYALARARVERLAVARPPTAAYIALHNEESKSMIFFEEIEQAERCVHLCKRYGLNSVSYNTSQSEAKRRNALYSFTYGLARVIVACRALDEGFDYPQADCAIIAAASHSSRQRIQRIGRVLRTSPNKLSAKVFTLYASDGEQKMLAAFSNHARWMEARI